MKIALDYDLTYSLDPAFWQGFIELARHANHDVRIVTARNHELDRTEPLLKAEMITDVIYCRGIAKKWYLSHFVPEFVPDVWIDDKPESILNNSTAPAEVLVEWRATRGEPVGEELIRTARMVGRAGKIAERRDKNGTDGTE